MGLLLLRIPLGITAIVHGANFLNGEAELWGYIVGITLTVLGTSITLGFLTPICGALLLMVGLVNVALSVAQQSRPISVAALFSIFLSALTLLLGPGGFSIDALLFGRREVVLPKN